jgi:RNA polymerase sigma-70 factor (ECF subfamily)
MENEDELIAGCLQGDADAWDALFDAHYAATARFVFQLSPDLTVADVEEICQEAFLSVIRNLEGFGGGSRLSTWIFRIAANKAHDYRARMRAAKRGGGRIHVSLQAADALTGVVPDPTSPALGPDEALMQEEQMQWLRGCLDEVGQPCRELIELRYFGGLSYDEIAADLGVNVKTVSSRLSRCLDRLETVGRAASPDAVRGKNESSAV